jgi:hypothetical protein
LSKSMHSQQTCLTPGLNSLVGKSVLQLPYEITKSPMTNRVGDEPLAVARIDSIVVG